MKVSRGCGWVWVGFVFLSACSHVSTADRDPASEEAIPEAGRPLYPMMGLDVVVKPGNVDRTPLGKHWAPHELATERSQPASDPSPELGYHFELAELRKQQGVAKDQAWESLTAAPAFFRRDREEKLDFDEAIAEDPGLLKLYELHRGRYAPGHMRAEDGPAIVNSDYEYRKISDREFGYCWGFATFNRFFAQLAFFDDRVVPYGLPAYVPGGFEKNEVWFRYYERKIDQILDGKAALIPGFRDFRSFTLVPEIEFYIKLKAMKLWSARAISLNMLKTFFTSTKPLTDAEIGKLLRELKTRTERGELPKIMFTAKNSHKVFGGTADVHVVLANGVELNRDGSGKILLWDINFYAEDYLKSPKWIEVRNVPGQGRQLHYAPWFENKETPKLTAESTMLGQVRITPENRRENDEMITSLKRFCAAPSTAKYCR